MNSAPKRGFLVHTFDKFSCRTKGMDELLDSQRTQEQPSQRRFVHIKVNLRVLHTVVWTIEEIREGRERESQRFGMGVCVWFILQPIKQNLKSFSSNWVQLIRNRTNWSKTLAYTHTHNLTIKGHNRNFHALKIKIIYTIEMGCHRCSHYPYYFETLYFALFYFNSRV